MTNNLKVFLLKLDRYGHGAAIPSTIPPRITPLTQLMTLCASFAVIVCLALFNPLGVTPDYAPYIASFDWARQANWSQVFPNPKAWEPGFMALVFLLAKAIAANSWVFFLIVTLNRPVF